MNNLRGSGYIIQASKFIINNKNSTAQLLG